MSDLKFKPKHDVCYTFRIARVADGPFKNLWQLKVQTPEDVDLVEIVDADSLSTVVAKVGYVFERDGF